MFHIGIVELALTCGIFLLVIIVPAIVVIFYKRIDQRLKNIEKRVEGK